MTTMIGSCPLAGNLLVLVPFVRTWTDPSHSSCPYIQGNCSDTYWSESTEFVMIHDDNQS